MMVESPAPHGDLGSRFADQIGRLSDTAERACLRLLPWAPQEHDTIIQESLERVWRRLRADADVAGMSDLAAYTYGVARNCVFEARRRLLRDETRACRLPADDKLVASLLGLDQEAPGMVAPALPPAATCHGLLALLRYYVVHAFAHATVKQRRRALRDTYVLARHYLRGIPIATIAADLDITERACRYAAERTLRELQELVDRETGDLRSFVVNSESFSNLSELSVFLREAQCQ